ncbi:MAG: hypothetical protein ACE5JH_02635 [Acidobacteriota bacterium]
MSTGRRRAAVVAASILALTPAGPILGWTGPTRTRMIRDALAVSPPALVAILEPYDDRLRAGMIEPASREGEEVHYQHADGRRGLAAAGIARKVEDARAMLLRRRSPARFAYEMGALAHLVADAAFPLNVSDADPREPLYREAYRSYIESVLDKIPFVLDRGGSEALEAGDVQAFIMESVRRAEASYPLIGPAFDDDGTPRTRAALDERSVPFGIASLAYSQAVSNIARIWRLTWASVDGDLRGTPYLTDPPPESASIPESER